MRVAEAILFIVMERSCGFCRDGPWLANGDLMEEGEAEDDCGVGGCRAERRGNSPDRGSSKGSWPIRSLKPDFRAHEFYGLRLET